MSENAIVVVELSTTPTDAPGRVVAAKKWLLEDGIIVPNEHRDRLMQRSEHRAGPRAIEVAPAFAHEHVRGLANNGVDFVCKRQVHHPSANYEPPDCPSCGARADSDAHSQLIKPWLENEEPVLACRACGQVHLAGDWTGKFSFYVSEVAVRFNNWPCIEPSFLAKLGEILGPRSRIVYEHF